MWGRVKFEELLFGSAVIVGVGPIEVVGVGRVVVEIEVDVEVAELLSVAVFLAETLPHAEAISAKDAAIATILAFLLV